MTAHHGAGQPGGELAALIDASGVSAPDGAGDAATDPEHLYEVERTVTELATSLARLHSVPLPVGIESAPHVATLTPSAIVAVVRADHDAGRIDPAALSDAYRHMTVGRLVEILAEHAPGESDVPMVLTHGRLTLERVRVVDTEVRFVDWSHAAVSDPHRDLATLARSVATELGPMLVPVLVERYLDARAASGSTRSPADPVRLDWYALAGELSP